MCTAHLELGRVHAAAVIMLRCVQLRPSQVVYGKDCRMQLQEHYPLIFPPIPLVSRYGGSRAANCSFTMYLFPALLAGKN